MFSEAECHQSYIASIMCGMANRLRGHACGHTPPHMPLLDGFASSGTGSSAHLVGTKSGMVSKPEMTHIPYNGSAPSLPDLMSGQVSMVFDPMLVPMPQAKAGKINVLAVASAKRLPAAPDVPTMEEAGFPGFVMNSRTGLLAPAGTPQPAIDRPSPFAFRP